MLNDHKGSVDKCLAAKELTEMVSVLLSPSLWMKGVRGVPRGVSRGFRKPLWV